MNDDKPMSAGTVIVLIILCFFIPLIGIPLLIIYVIKHAHEADGFVVNVKQALNEKIEEVTAEQERKKRPNRVKCKYCGAKCTGDHDKCPNCGAPLD